MQKTVGAHLERLLLGRKLRTPREANLSLFQEYVNQIHKNGMQLTEEQEETENSFSSGCVHGSGIIMSLCTAVTLKQCISFWIFIDQENADRLENILGRGIVTLRGKLT